MKYESPQTDKDGLSQNAIEMEIKTGIKHIPHECPGCGETASVFFNGISFCRNKDCITKGRF